MVKPKKHMHSHIHFLQSVLSVALLSLLITPLGAQTTLPSALPKLRYHGVVLSAADLKYAPHDDVIFPAVVKIGRHVKKPLGNYYMYYAPHDVPGGICLAYADKPQGPWTESATNPVINRHWAAHHSVSHVSGPDVIWSPEERRLFLYYHGENDVTRLATSKDGIYFEYVGAVVNAKMFEQTSEASYGRVFRHELPGKDNRYIMLLMGNQGGTRRIFLAWSRDGRQWEAQKAPMFGPPPGTDQVAGAVYLPRGGHHYLIYHANNSTKAFNEGYDLYYGETDPAFSRVTHLGKFMERTFVSADNPAVMSPCFVNDDNGLSLFVNIGPRLKNKIALATEVSR